MEALGGRIRALREAEGVGVRELARCIRVNPGAVSRWERGDRLPSLPAAYRVACFFGLTLDELVAGTIVEMDESMPRAGKRGTTLKRGGPR